MSSIGCFFLVLSLFFSVQVLKVFRMCFLSSFCLPFVFLFRNSNHKPNLARETSAAVPNLLELLPKKLAPNFQIFFQQRRGIKHPTLAKIFPFSWNFWIF
ncbi:hypothetical protein Pfo_016349 [Paulownia fortunei]|nr:hypothetical protein Pfo_016349 [Paulownia fortunei]